MSFRNTLIAGAAAIGMAMSAPAAAQQLAQVTTDLNLRAAPGGQIITAMPRGSQVHIHQCPSSWCQVTYGNVTGWASQRYLSTGVALQPRPRTYASAQPSVSFGIEVGPRYRDRGPRHRYGSQYHRWSPGWYDDHYYDGRRWYYDDRWYDRPRTGFSFSFGR
ncbi:MAG TPA: SH3 domain-containing protein [Afifellaceae bacterium]|nr:SH3 domain-containing protein [Afifellaceae bacterium]